MPISQSMLIIGYPHRKVFSQLSIVARQPHHDNRLTSKPPFLFFVPAETLPVNMIPVSRSLPREKSGPVRRHWRRGKAIAEVCQVS